MEEPRKHVWKYECQAVRTHEKLLPWTSFVSFTVCRVTLFLILCFHTTVSLRLHSTELVSSNFLIMFQHNLQKHQDLFVLHGTCTFKTRVFTINTLFSAAYNTISTANVVQRNSQSYFPQAYQQKQNGLTRAITILK